MKVFFSIIGLVLVVLLLGVLVGIIPVGMFVPESRAIRALETQGYSQVEITHKAVYFIGWRGGDKCDKVRFTAKAINPIGKEVTVYVFSGWLLKGCTIRTF